MGQRKLTQKEREQIYVKKQNGSSLPEIAKELGISYGCARKWWRRGRDEGITGLLEQRRGRPVQGILSEFDPEVREAAIQLKRKHKRWGARRVLIEMSSDANLRGKKLPSRSRLYAFFKQECPGCLSIWTKHKTLPKPISATAVHEIWQIDHQEGHRLVDGSIATVCNIRDPYGAAMIASQAFEVKTKQRWRKLTWEEVRQVVRDACSEWQTMPDSIQTDNEMSLGGNPNDPFPSSFSLWCAGLGIKHIFIRSHHPKDQAQVERCHRTMDGLTDDEDSRQNMVSFQQSLDKERQVHNHLFPSQASDCMEQSPIQAHSHLLSPRRPYRPEWELALFSMQNVYNFLATFELDRKVNRNGQATLKGIHYTVGLSHAEKQIKVRFDPQAVCWVFFEFNSQGVEVELRRQNPVGLDIQTLTGLHPEQLPPPSVPIQLTLPLVA